MSNEYVSAPILWGLKKKKINFKVATLETLHQYLAFELRVLFTFVTSTTLSDIATSQIYFEDV